MIGFMKVILCNTVCTLLNLNIFKIRKDTATEENNALCSSSIDYFFTDNISLRKHALHCIVSEKLNVFVIFSV